MLSSPRPKTLHPAPLDGRLVVVLALWLSFSAIGLDQFLRTSPAQFSGQPGTAIGHWIADSMMALPLFAIGVLIADWMARRLRLGLARRADVLKRALLVSAACALVLAPAWFQVDRTDNPVTAQPLVFPQAHDSSDVYWVTSGVIVALASASLVPLAAWAGLRLTSPMASRSPVQAAGIARFALIVLLVAAMPLLAWLLHRAAERAYASRVYETSSPGSARPRPHQVQATLSPVQAAPSPVQAAPPRTPGQLPVAAPYAFGYQAAHALQDGLVGQAAGLPVALVVLAWGTGVAGTSRKRPEASRVQPSAT